jgi:hypothetical protein
VKEDLYFHQPSANFTAALIISQETPEITVVSSGPDPNQQ